MKSVENAKTLVFAIAITQTESVDDAHTALEQAAKDMLDLLVTKRSKPQDKYERL